MWCTCLKIPPQGGQIIPSSQMSDPQGKLIFSLSTTHGHRQGLKVEPLLLSTPGAAQLTSILVFHKSNKSVKTYRFLSRIAQKRIKIACNVFHLGYFERQTDTGSEISVHIFPPREIHCCFLGNKHPPAPPLPVTPGASGRYHLHRRVRALLFICSAAVSVRKYHNLSQHVRV